jgi:hypothetical protein
MLVHALPPKADSTQLNALLPHPESAAHHFSSHLPDEPHRAAPTSQPSRQEAGRQLPKSPPKTHAHAEAGDRQQKQRTEHHQTS